MIRIQQIKVPVKHSHTDIEKKIQKILRLKSGQAFTYRIWKQSIDARRKNEVSYVYTVDVFIKEEAKLIHMVNDKNIMLTKEKKYKFQVHGTMPLKQRPVIAGSGPAGLFCAYQLALYGYRPIILERGKQADQRQKDVEQFWNNGILNPNSNVQFGEGGAGTFSDGKLNTLVKDPLGRNRYVLETFVQCGADDSILYVNKPHIGTDVLVDVVRNLRNEIIRLGGTFYFETCLTDIQIQRDGSRNTDISENKNGNRLCSITVETGGVSRKINTDLLVLAIGHSARDTFEMLYRRQVPMEAKAFAVGFRVEHPQHMINEHQYKGADMRFLPAASYKVTASGGGRGVYSFCMCPGGYVVNASSEEGRLAVNGMSYQKRDGENANSAVIMAVTPADYPSQTPLGGIEFQRRLEERAYELGGGKIPQQLYGDFKAGRLSDGYGSFASQAKGACAFTDLRGLLPPALNEAFMNGMQQFADYIPDFDRYDAILSGVESRTSSPVRIPRDDTLQSSIQGLYPCGEGAGYAGGIMSAAMDGMKTAEAVAAVYRPFD